MAYVPSTADTEDQTQFQPGTPQTAVPPATSTGAAGAGGAQSGQGATATVAKGTPPPVTNLGDYLAANAPQAVGMGNTIAGNLTAQGQMATGDINADQAAVNQEVQAQDVAPNPGLVGEAEANPAGFVTNPANLTDFLAQENAAYTGPATYESTPQFAAATGEAQNVAANAPVLNTDAGINQLVSGSETNPTAGEEALDAALIEETPGAIAPVAAAEVPLQALPSDVTQGATQEDAAIQQAIADDLASSQGATTGLATAQGNEAQNLTAEQNTLQGIIDEYNKSVGVINPVTSTIESDIQQFLAANPSLDSSVAGLGNPLAPFLGLSDIGMPSEATYASPGDYADVAALGQLGDQNVGTLPISSATADEAQTFQLPGALQTAVGAAPGVENALQAEVNDIGSAIDTAGGTNSAASYQTQENLINTTQAQINTLQPQVQAATQALTQAGVQTAGKGAFQNPYAPNNPKYQSTQALIDNYNSLNGQMQTAQQTIQGAQGDAESIAATLGGLGAEDTGYTNLVDEINAQLSQLGQVGAPTLNYAPNTLTDPVTGAAVSPVTEGNVAGTAVGTGAVGGSTLESALSGLSDAGPGIAGATGAGEAASLPSTTIEGANGLEYTQPGYALPASAEGTPEVAGSLSPGATVAPAALAAYGTSNAIQNAQKNPIQSGIQTLANTGLSIAELSFPPQIFNSIEGGVQQVLSDIGNFFSGIF